MSVPANQEEKKACLILPAAALSGSSLFCCFICTFQLFHLRTINATGDISTPRMNWKPPSSKPFSQQQHQSGAKSAGQEKNLYIFKTIFLLMIFIFSITSLQGGLHNQGYLCPQNEWKLVTPSPCHQQHYQEGGKRVW